MNYALFDDIRITNQLLPLTYLRPVSEIRIGINTISEKWEHFLGGVSHHTRDYLASRYPSTAAGACTYINGALIPEKEIVEEINGLQPGEAIRKGDDLLAYHSRETTTLNGIAEKVSIARETALEVLLIDRPWKIFQNNGRELRADFERLSGGKSEKISDRFTAIYGEENIFVGKNVEVKSATIDAENGPVYLADNSRIAPGSVIRGPFALLEGSELNMGARMRGDITIGPRCKVGGEVSNSIFFGNSNKAHDGFVGNSVIAEWCNLGADTNTSNMKNDYTDVKLWNYNSGRFESSKSTFCGLIMGDHSKSGINVMFNSGTSVGICTSIYNANYPRNFIPSFVKGSANGWNTMSVKEASRIAERAMARRDVEFNDSDLSLFEKVFELSASYRRS